MNKKHDVYLLTLSAALAAELLAAIIIGVIAQYAR